MPRYHFNTTDGERDEDRQGSVYDDVAAALVAAVRYAGDLLSDTPDTLLSRGEFTVDVADDSGVQLFSIVVALKTAHRSGDVGSAS